MAATNIPASRPFAVSCFSLLLSHKFQRIYPPSPNVFLVLKLGRGITELVESSVSFAILYMYEGERSHEDNNKLAKLGDAIAISKSETIRHSLTHSTLLYHVSLLSGC